MTLRDLRLRLRALFFHRREETGLRDEVDFHLAMETRKRASQGDAAAARHAEVAFGGTERVLEECRDARGLIWLDAAKRDLRHGFRGLLHTPVFTLVAVVTLALGIGANTAIFTWVDAELLRALPYDHPAQLLAIDEYANGRIVSDTYPDFVDFRAQNQRPGGTFSAMAWFQQLGFNLSGAGVPEVVTGADVSGNFFSTLGVHPWLGREFSPGADAATAAPEAVLSFALWQRQFGGSPAALGRTLNLDDRAYSVVGVLPPEFRDYNQTDVFLPAGLFLKDLANSRGSHNDADILARLKPGATSAAAAAQIRAGMAALARAYPASNEGEGTVVRPIRALFVGSDAPMLWMLLAAVGLVLLIACANVANLLLIRTAARQPELAMRAALGASRARLTGQLLVESLLLAALGAGGGIILAVLAMAGLRPLATGVTLRLNAPVLAFTLGLTVLAALLFGTLPALRASRSGVGAGMRATRTGRRGALVVAEVALALMLAAGAGWMLKSFSRLMAVNPGFRAQQVLTFGTSLGGPRYAADITRLDFARRVLARLQALPGVSVAGIGTALPLSGDHDRADITIDGVPLPAPGHFPHPDFHAISPGYLPALGLPLMRGRNFNAGDTAASPQVALVNESLAKQYWPNQDPIGRRFWLGHPAPQNHNLVTVVGVVGNTRQYGLNAPIRLEVYQPFEQSASSHPQFVLRTEVPPLSLSPAAAAAVHAVDAEVPVVGAQSMDAMVAASVASPRTTLWLLAIFGGLALVLAAIGIYGVVAYAAQQRANEIGVRMALGAGGGAIARLVGGESVRWIGAGLALGLVGALGAGHFIASLLFGVTPADVEVLATVTGILLLVGLLASAVPVWRAARLDPWQALRRE